MLTGRFRGTHRRPFLRGIVRVPLFGIQQPVEFLVDTGADTSALMPRDSVRLGIPFTQLARGPGSIGIGGPSNEYVARASISFLDSDGRIHSYLLDLAIVGAGSGVDVLPSLLGRDILNRWRMVYDPSIDELSFEVHTADRTLAPRPSGR